MWTAGLSHGLAVPTYRGGGCRLARRLRPRRRAAAGQERRGAGPDAAGGGGQPRRRGRGARRHRRRGPRGRRRGGVLRRHDPGRRRPPGLWPVHQAGRADRRGACDLGEGRFRAGEPVFLELSGCVGRYHAPLGRLVPIGEPRAADAAMAAIAARAFDAVVAALRPGVQGTRGLCGLAVGGRRCGARPLSAAPLRLSRRRRRAPLLDRRQHCDRAPARQRPRRSRPG